MDEIKTKLMEELESEIEGLQNLDVGSNEHKMAVEDITKLADRVIEIFKIEGESERKAREYLFDKDKLEKELNERIKSRELDERTKAEQAKDNRKFKWLEIGIAVIGIAVPTIVKVWGTNKTLKFEENGTVTTMSGRAHINSLFTKK